MNNMNRITICLQAALMILLLGQAAQAGDWPMFRHDLNH